MKDLISYVIDNWGVLLSVVLVVLEAALRLKPANANWSIIEFFIRVINLILPNRTTYYFNGKKIKTKFKIKKDKK